MEPNKTWLMSLSHLLLQQSFLPKHIGVIMDGNRRYAKEHGIRKAEAYEIGIQTFESVIEFCFAAGVEAMTFYAFSMANFRRSDEEIRLAMRALQDCCSRLLRPGSVAERFEIKLRVCGNKSLLPAKVLHDLEHAENVLGKDGKCVINLCVAYGSRQEITYAVRAAIMKHHRFSTAGGDNLSNSDVTGPLGPQNAPDFPYSQRITVDALEDEMSTAGCPPMDLLLRTAETSRLSDFMLWQCHRDTVISIVGPKWPGLTALALIQPIIWWKTQTSLAKVTISMRQAPSVLHMLIRYFFLILLLSLRTCSTACWHFHALRNCLADTLHEQEVSLKKIHEDTRRLKRLPTHLSVILRITDDPNELDKSLNTVADLMMWCISVGVPLLSVYERTGKLKSNKCLIHRLVATKLLHHHGAHWHNFNVLASEAGQSKTIERCGPADFSLLLISAEDGRESLTEICNVLVSSVRQGKMFPEEIDIAQINKMLKTMLLASLDDSSIAKASDPSAGGMLIDPSKGALNNNRDILDQKVLDPDILFIFGSSIQFDGYPPWQLATPEIFCTGDDSAGFGRHGSFTTYRFFLQGLYGFAGAEIRLGR